MKTVAIICEYNPFHNGHKYHIMETKKKTCNCANEWKLRPAWNSGDHG